MIDLTVCREGRQRAARRARERGVVIPTFAQMRDPALVPEERRGRLLQVGLWDLEPANLFRITWKNQPVERGGGFGPGERCERAAPSRASAARRMEAEDYCGGLACWSLGQVRTSRL